MPIEDEGLKVILSAVQLAAVLRGATLGSNEKKLYRLFGTLQLIGSAFELVGGVALEAAPDPTLLTKVGGGLLLVHGSDSAYAAWRQIKTGQPTKDYTQQLGERLALGVGVSQQKAEWAGIALDVAVPLGVSVAVSAERLLAVRAGRISLAEHEASTTEALGHTIRDHVGKDEAFLRARLSDPKNVKMKAASTFSSLQIAEDTLSDAMRAEATNITSWASKASPGARYPFQYTAKSPIGWGVVRATGQIEQMTKVQLVLVKTQLGGRVFFILTSHPTL